MDDIGPSARALLAWLVVAVVFPLYLHNSWRRGRVHEASLLAGAWDVLMLAGLVQAAVYTWWALSL